MQSTFVFICCICLAVACVDLSEDCSDKSLCILKSYRDGCQKLCGCLHKIQDKTLGTDTEASVKQRREFCSISSDCSCRSGQVAVCVHHVCICEDPVGK